MVGSREKIVSCRLLARMAEISAESGGGSEVGLKRSGDNTLIPMSRVEQVEASIPQEPKGGQPVSTEKLAEVEVQVESCTAVFNREPSCSSASASHSNQKSVQEEQKELKVQDLETEEGTHNQLNKLESAMEDWDKDKLFEFWREQITKEEKDKLLALWEEEEREKLLALWKEEARQEAEKAKLLALWEEEENDQLLALWKEEAKQEEEKAVGNRQKKRELGGWFHLFKNGQGQGPLFGKCGQNKSRSQSSGQETESLVLKNEPRKVSILSVDNIFFKSSNGEAAVAEKENGNQIESSLYPSLEAVIAENPPAPPTGLHQADNLNATPSTTNGQFNSVKKIVRCICTGVWEFLITVCVCLCGD